MAWHSWKENGSWGSLICYLGIDFTMNGVWDMHIKEVQDSGRNIELLVTGT